MNDRYVSAGVIAACKELEAALLPLGCKPHWGKLHHMGLPTLTQQYGEEDMARFRALCAKSLFCAVLCLKTEHLPRQAQDKHSLGKLTEKRRFSHRCETHDPKGVFRNDWFERLIFDDSEDHLKLVLPAEEVPAEASN